MIKVMLIDDSAVVRQTLSDIINSDSHMEVAATAADPIIAAKKLETLNPDVIVLDIEMPRMDGITFLKKLMREHPTPVVICSSKAEEGSDNALKALDYGAADIIQKPKIGTKQFLEESRVMICDVIKAAALTKTKTFPAAAVRPRPALAASAAVPEKLTADVILPKPKGTETIETTEKVVVVGASTGGTEALKLFLEAMPINSPGIVIVQHMPEHFTAAFAKRLDGLCSISVKEAEHNDSVLRGRALIAPGNKHTLLKRSGARYYVEVKDGPLVSRHRPSVDVLFRSSARYAGKNAIGVIMTGMGDDGARGMLEMRESGAYNIAQDEKSSIVFGMPGEAVKHGAVDEILTLSAIAHKVIQLSS